MLWPQTASDILVMDVGSAGGVLECVTTALFNPCMCSSPVWQDTVPSHPGASPPGPVCDKPQLTATHSQSRKWQPSGQLFSRSAVKMEQFPFYCTSEGAIIVSALSVGDWVTEDMSVSCQLAGPALVPLWSGSLKLQYLMPSAGWLATWLNPLVDSWYWH